MNEPIISVSGLRGIIGESLDPILAIKYSTAFASLLESEGPIVVTRDGRSTGTMLAQAICSGLSAMGRDVMYGDVAATPTTGILVREHSAAAGIQISASHNPAPYNGIKLFNSTGRVIPADEGEKVIEAYRDYKFNAVTHDKIGKIANIEDTTSEHLDSLYMKHGYHQERLVNIRMEGSDGMKRMEKLMAKFRSDSPKTLGGLEVTGVKDYSVGKRMLPNGSSESINGPTGNVLIFETAIEGNYIAARPSGTEPKVKFYMFTYVAADQIGDLGASKAEMSKRIDAYAVDMQAFADSV